MPSEEMNTVDDMMDNIKVHGVKSSMGKMMNVGLDKAMGMISELRGGGFGAK